MSESMKNAGNEAIAISAVSAVYDNTQEQQTEVKRAYESGKKVTLRSILMVIAIVVGIALVLFVVSRAALYDSVFTMLSDMGAALGEVLHRIFS